MYLRLFELFTAFCSILFTVQSSNNNGDIISWCYQTPYPTTCKYYMEPLEKNTSDVLKHEFRDLVIGVAKQQALEALHHTKALGVKCRNKREKTAWADCLKLYESTVVLLNNSLKNDLGSSFLDTQIWLSAALTNLDTCREGFYELGITKNVLPLMSNNVSFLISNCLSINKPTREPWEGGFPSWMPKGDLRILKETKGQNGRNGDIVVAKDGSGNFRTITEALKYLAKRQRRKIFVIYVKAGVYDECFEVSLSMKDVMLVGDGMRKTIITGHRSVKGGYTTVSSATVSIVGDGFIARDITFRNTAGRGSQAVALLSRADRSVFYRCSFEGYQDTLFVHSQRQFYSQCLIFGTIDFILGNAAVVFQNCFIYTRQPMWNQVTITAQSRTNPNQTTGISIDRCIVRPVKGQHKPFVAYLGRPWRDYARVVYIKSYIDGIVAREGWLAWGDRRLDTLYYGEYGNRGPGSSTLGRVRWGGYHDIKNVREAMRFSVRNLLRGKAWLPWTGVPFRLDI